MIVTSLNSNAFRMHSPRWAFMPTSGAGAGLHGGSLNRPGVDALYLSLEVSTALAEYQQLSTLQPPGTMVSYQVELDRVVDFCEGYSEQWDPLWKDFYCDWRKMRFDLGIDPPTWDIGDLVLYAGCQGILFSSALSGVIGTNRIVYDDMLSGKEITVHDPNHELPKDQKSWL